MVPRNITSMGNYFWAPGTEFLGRKCAFYSAGQSKTPVDRLARMLPAVFRELAGVVFGFSRVVQ